MSNYDLLTPQEHANARAEGWDVFYVFDTQRQRWLVAPLPLQFSPSVGAAEVMRGVVTAAQCRNQLGIKVLRLCAHFRPHSTSRKKK